MAHKIRPQIKLSYGRQNSPLRIPINDLLISAPGSFLTNDYTSGASSIAVQSIDNFAINQILLIGKPGIENSEIIKTSASVAPSALTVTLASATTKGHSNSDSVNILQYDQVEISFSLTADGTTTVLDTIPITVETETKYYDEANTTGFYFARFKNSITGYFSEYSDPCPVGSYAMSTARWIIDTALDEINKTTSDVFSDEYGFKQLNKCQMEVLRELKRWSWMQVFGATTPCAVGDIRIALPNDIDDSNTNKSIFNFRLGKDPNMTWVSKDEWDNITQGAVYGFLEFPLNMGDSTLGLIDTSNFAQSGTVTIGNDTLTYTANDTTNNVLTLASPSTVSHIEQSGVYQFATYGSPTYYTVFSGYAWVYPIVDILHDKMDYSMDYYSSLTPIQTDTDMIVVPDPVLCVDYLRWKFLKRMNNGEETDGSLEAKQCFIDRKDKLVKKESMNRKIVMKPRFNDYSRLNIIDGDSKQTRTQGFWPNW